MVKTEHPGEGTHVAEYGFHNPDRAPLGIEVTSITCLASRLSPQALTGVHRTDFHQIILVAAGEAITMVDFQDHPSPPGTLLHVAPGRVLRLPRPVRPADPVQAAIVLFTPAFLPPLGAARTLLTPFSPAVWRLAPHENTLLTAALGELAAEYRSAVRDPCSATTAELLRHLLAALVLRLARLPGPHDSQPGPSTTAGDTFLRFQHELERSFATTRNAAAYAARVGYSLPTLNRACQAATGRNAKTLIDARVALEAGRLLAHTDLPVAAIGRRLGFTEPTNFGKFFTRETGLPPGTFRTQQRP
ncbi:AraC family transcriptional regulator [Streptomyces flavotricini]|uniref:AraC family transcriptional regulator n=1 Tax=Streptomyces flavotricini TaxID=66888 RepID=A0ABS8DWX2_9ACTN|nr:helix-turn-helix domain-containing protein [Streptomyces flavotricini]MCC0093321.1 AraC family transcriptional regulator [Streptomyces flavotricini]